MFGLTIIITIFVAQTTKEHTMEGINDMKVTKGTHDKIRTFLRENKDKLGTDEYLRLADIASTVDLQVRTKTAARRMTMEQIIYSVDHFEERLMELGCCGYERITVES